MTPSEQISKYISGLPDWRGQTLARLRELTLAADADIVEEWKWNSPVWSRNGLVSSVGAFKGHVAVNFFQGASLEDPTGLFNASLDAKATRSIRLLEGDALNDTAFQDLVRAAVAHNMAGR